MKHSFNHRHLHHSFCFRGLNLFVGIPLLAILTLPWAARGQLTIMDNFNSGNDTAWSHYAPLQTAPWNEQVTWTFPTDPAGGFYYRIFGGVPNISHDPASDNQTGPARVGSFRNDSTYTDFSAGVDLVNWNDAIPLNTGFLGFHITTPGFLTTFGFFAGYSRGAWDDQMSTFGFVFFQSELQVSGVSDTVGGVALMSRLNLARKYRMVATGQSTNYFAAIYDRTDLLEPIVKIGGTTNSQPSGTAGVGIVSYTTDDDKIADFTFDNYYSSANPADPVGFPGTPQVVHLNPAPQTLFYQPPNNGSNITFNIATFNTNQINTNAFAFYTNGVQVPAAALNLFEVRDALVGTHNTNFFVKYTGPLAANTIYNGQIVALDMSGKGTTNNFVFDTFSTSGILLVEAEDYNFGGGMSEDNPPVSGLDPDGVQVNGWPTGYWGAQGTPDVDYHDTETGSSNGDHQYRPADGVGTIQNVFAGDTPRPDHVATNVPDYAIWRMLAGEWLNYTRNFPANKWNVYLRTSSQARQDIRFDQVTGDITMPNQATVLRGNFLVPNTGSSTRFRYVPLTDAAGNPQVVSFSGTNTFRMTALGSLVRGNGDNVGSVQPTYFLFVPSAAAAPTTPWIASASPSANATDVPVQPTVQIVIMNRSSSVSLGSIQLRVDGSNVTSSATITNGSVEGAGATVVYSPPGYLLPNSTHSLSLTFSDGSVSQSNQWNFTTANLPLIPTSFALASSPGTNFHVQVHKAPNNATYSTPADNTMFPNSSWRAERQLANQLIQPSTLAPYTNEAANTPTNYGFYTEPVAINYDACAVSAGFFPGDNNFPGIYPSNYCGSASTAGFPENFAIAATIKLPVAAGLYRMGVRSDDGFKLTVTTNDLAVWTNAPQTEIQLGIFDAARGNNETTFDFVVATNGVYDFRLLYEQGGVNADCEWYWVNRTTGARELVRPLQLESSANVTGPYAAETGAQYDPGAKTITLARSGSTRFYRLRSTTTYTLSPPVLSGNNVVLGYQ